VFYLANGDAMNAIVTLPVDPLDPFFEIFFLNSAWSYFYGDRTFYETRSNEPGSHYVQGSAAFESTTPTIKLSITSILLHSSL
jgi:hypothetical protein